MAATIEEGTEMKRRKRLTIKMVALGLAVAGIAAAPAQAKLDEGLGLPKQSEPTLAVGSDDRGFSRMAPTQIEPNVIVGSDDRGFSRMSPTQIEPNVIVSPDDRKVSRTSPTTASQPSLISSDDGFEIGTLGMTGIVLLLGAGAAVVAVQHTRKGKLASA
jgi:hypothetical protein